MKLADFDYPLPKDRIAQAPLPDRAASRLLVLDRAGGTLRHQTFPDLLDYLRPDDLVVLNDTRVVPARLHCRRITGGKVDALVVGRLDGYRREALLDTPRRLRVGERLQVDGQTHATLIERRSDRWVLEFEADPEELLRIHGRMPLPPYIKREAGPEDERRYQTVYASREGAIAAPTAGLHFTKEILARLPCPHAALTLHVGIGTFRPVKTDRIEEHLFDPEWYDIPEETEEAIRSARRVVAVGTTTCRTLETWARTGKRSGGSDLFIHPPFEFRIVKALLTNFHLPKSTLLMLVSAFAGRERILAAYRDAIDRGYRFFSYGDAMFIR